jgi:hypothetical protein
MSSFQLKEFQSTTILQLEQFDQQEIQGLLNSLETKQMDKYQQSYQIFGKETIIDDPSLIVMINKQQILQKSLGEQEQIYLEAVNLYQDAV